MGNTAGFSFSYTGFATVVAPICGEMRQTSNLSQDPFKIITNETDLNLDISRRKFFPRRFEREKIQTNRVFEHGDS